MSALSFSKPDKLTHSKEFGKLSRLGKKVVNQHFVILYLINSLEQSRLGITISKKASKLAVQRNRVKRVTREFFRHHRPSAHHFDIVVIARHNIAQVTNKMLVDSLGLLWEKIDRI